MTDIDIDAIRQREQAATPGPWGWRGHISQSVELRALHSGGLRIISTSRGEPCIGLTDDESIVLMSNACKTCSDWLTNGGIGRGDDLKCEKPENLDTVWAWHPKGFIRPINDWAKAEVLQWSNHMYRDDVKDTTHPDAEFIAHARQDVPDLLAKVDELTAELSAVADAIAPTVTIKPTSDAARFLHNLYLDWVKTAHQRLAQIDELTAALAKSREQAATYATEIGRLTAENARVRQQRDAHADVVEAAKAWRAQFSKDSITKGPRMAALMDAVDALPKAEAVR